MNELETNIQLTENDILHVRKDRERIENEIQLTESDILHVENDIEQIERETEQLRAENARDRALRASIRRLCFPQESCSIPATATEPGSRPSSTC